MIRVLLDENLPRRLKGSLDTNGVAEALTVPERGWGGIKNGPLLALAASEFDVLSTMDRGIAYQQNLGGVDLCMVVLRAVSNDLDDLRHSLALRYTANKRAPDSFPCRRVSSRPRRSRPCIPMLRQDPIV